MKLSVNSSVTAVLPGEPTKREQFAAEELRKYLGVIFPGIRVSFAAAGQPVEGLQILIGGPERNAATALWISEEAFDALVPGPEGI